jgi:tetratricopeptide (TPR) repeat protein
MAKRRKLNKRVVIVLSVIGVLVILLGAAAIYKLAPKDPLAFEEDGDEAMAKGDYDAATRGYGTAIHHAKGDTDLKLRLYGKYADAFSKWLEQPGLSDTRRREMRAQVRKALSDALLLVPDHVPYLERLCEFYWGADPRLRIPDEFLRRADALLKHKPDAHETHYRRGLILGAKARMISREDYEQPAEEALKRAIELKRDEPAYWTGLAEFRAVMGKEDDALKTYGEALEVIPNSADLLIDYASLLGRLRRVDEARERLEAAIRAEPENPAGQMAMARYLFARGKLDECLAAIEKAKAIAPDRHEPYELAFTTLRRKARYEEAISALRAGVGKLGDRIEQLRRDEAAREGRLALQRERDDYYLKLADTVALLAVGRKREAGIRETQRRLAEAAGNKEEGAEREAQRKEAEEKVRQRVTQAREYLDKLEYTPPDSFRRLRIEGQIAIAEDRIEEAVGQLERSWEESKRANQPDMRAIYTLVLQYRALGSLTKAEKALAEVRKNPALRNDPHMLCLDAQFKISAREYEAAARLLDIVLAGHPDHFEAQRLREQLVVGYGKPRLHPDVKINALTLRLLLRQIDWLWYRDQQDDAVSLLAELVQREPGNVPLVLKLLGYYRELGRMSDHQALLKKALAADPDNRQLRLLDGIEREDDPQKAFEKTMALAEEEPDPVRRLLQKAGICRNFRRMADAARYLTEAGKQAPDSPAVAQAMFSHALSVQDWERAEKWARHAAEVAKRPARGKLALAQVAMAKGEYLGREQQGEASEAAYREAVALIEEALAKGVEERLALSMLGNCHLALREPDKAESAFKGVLALDRSYVNAVIGLARVASLRGNWDEWETQIKEAYRLRPEHPQVRDWILELQQRESTNLEDLIRQRERKFRAEPTNVTNALRLIDLYEQTRRLTEAERTALYLYRRIQPKIYGAGVLCRLYARHSRFAAIDPIIDQLLRTEKDKAGVYLLYAAVLSDRRPEETAKILVKAVQDHPDDPRVHRAMGQFRVARREWQEAIVALERCLELRPDADRERRLLIAVYMSAGELDKALHLLEGILEKDPSDTWANAQKARFLARKGSFQQAEELLNKVIDREPNDPDLYAMRSEVHEVRGDLFKAAADLERARTLTGAPGIAMKLAEVYRRMEEYGKAALVYQSILTGREKYAPAYTELIQLHRARQSWASLEGVLDRARKAFPADPKYHLLEAEMWERRGNNVKRVAALRSAVALSPMEPGVVTALLQALVSVKNYDAVLKATDQLINEAELRYWVLPYRAAALVKLDRREEGDRDFAESLKNGSLAQLGTAFEQMREAYGAEGAVQQLAQWNVRGDDWLYQFRLGELFRNVGGDEQLDESIRRLEKSLQTAPNDKARLLIHGAMGLSYQMKKDFTMAEREYNTVLKARPNDVNTLNNLAYMYAEGMKQPQKAVEHAAKAARLRPGSPNVQDTYGWALAMAGRTEEALPVLQRATAGLSPEPLMLYHLGWTHEKLEQYEEALRAYRRAQGSLGYDRKDNLEKTLSDAIARVREKQPGT